MSKKIEIWGPNQELIVIYQGMFDMDGLYRMICDWFRKRGFEVHEKVYKDKHPPIGDEQEIKIDAFRNDSEFLRVWGRLFIHTWNMKKVEVVKDGIKKMLDKGRLKVTIRAEFELDYENKWEDTKFHEGLRDLYIGAFQYKKITQYGDKIEYEFHNLQEAMKQFFDMQAKGNQFADMWGKF